MPKRGITRTRVRVHPDPLTVNMSISLPPDLRDTLAEMAARNRRSISAQATVLIEAGLKALEGTGGNPLVP